MVWSQFSDENGNPLVLNNASVLAVHEMPDSDGKLIGITTHAGITFIVQGTFDAVRERVMVMDRPKEESAHNLKPVTLSRSELRRRAHTDNGNKEGRG